MPAFCGNCGSALAANASFCPNCGNRAAAATPAAKKGSSVLKILLVAFCLLAVAGMAVVGGMIYLGHRVKQAIVQKAEENGVDLHSLANAASGTGDRGKSPRVCRLLTAEQASQLIGEPIERTEPRETSCLYYGPAGLSARLAQEKWDSTLKRRETSGSDINSTEAATAVDQLVNNMAAQGENGGDQPLLMVSVDADGKPQMAAILASKSVFNGLGRDVPGLGDKAVFMPKLGLNVLRGGTFLRIIPGPFPDSDAKTIAVARSILAKL